MTDLSHDLRISREALEAAEKRAAEAERACAALKAGLLECAEEFEYASQYKGDFLAKKHGDDKTVERLRALAAGAPIDSGWLSPEQGAEKDARIAALEEAIRAWNHCACDICDDCCDRFEKVAPGVVFAAHPTEEADGNDH